MSRNGPLILRESDIMPLNDLKIFRRFSHLRAAMCGGLNYVHRQARFLSGNGASSAPCFSSVRRSVQRQLQGQGVLLPRTISLHGVRPVNVPRELARYRVLPASTEEQAQSNHAYYFAQVRVRNQKH